MPFGVPVSSLAAIAGFSCSTAIRTTCELFSLDEEELEEEELEEKTFAALGQAAAKKPADVAPPKKEETKPKAPAQTSQPSNAGSIPSGIYRIGSTGSAVTELQSQLRSVGVFNQDPTGYYGTVTQKKERV